MIIVVDGINIGVTAHEISILPFSLLNYQGKNSLNINKRASREENIYINYKHQIENKEKLIQKLKEDNNTTTFTEESFSSS
jgi:hypothetical protein